MMTSHNTHHTSPLKRKGFTLSELLVSLSVLGLIAALTLPSVFKSVKASKERAVWKETINALSTALRAGVDSGEITDTYSTVAYFKTHLVASEIRNSACPDAQPYPATTVCFRFHNGAVMNMIGGGHEFLYLDVNGAEGPNSGGVDRISLNWNPTQITGYAPFGSRQNPWPIRPGEILPSWNSDVALYKKIYGTS
jgi:prepilin-type N-terminal cleavage/methylation domain-containing protein